MKLNLLPFFALFMILGFESCTKDSPYVATQSTVTVPANITVYKNTAVAATNFVSNPAGATFEWTNSNTAIGLAANGSGDIPSFTAINNGTTTITATITVTPTAKGVKGIPSSYTITITAVPTVIVPANITVNDGAIIAATTFVGLPVESTFSWTNSNVDIGLPADGLGDIPSFTATNLGLSTISSTITVTPIHNGEVGTPSSFTITVKSSTITLLSGGERSHNMGKDCMTCHTSATEAGGSNDKRVWKIGGTIYNNFDGIATAPNVRVNFYTGPEATGKLKYTMVADALGNIYSSNPVDLTIGLFPEVVGATTKQYMYSALTTGACNSCHTGIAGQRDRVWAN